MTLLEVTWTLTWEAQLSEEGYTCWTLRDQTRRRWAWIINAGVKGWTAHVGDWGQAARVGMRPTPVYEELEHFDRLGEAKDWAEEKLAARWREHSERVRLADVARSRDA